MTRTVLGFDKALGLLSVSQSEPRTSLGILLLERHRPASWTLHLSERASRLVSEERPRLSPVGRPRKVAVTLAMLLAMSIIVIPRPVSAIADFTVTASPAEVTIPLGYWADVMVTVMSLNGLTGRVQIGMPVGGGTGLSGAGFSTGMQLNPGGNASTVLILTPGNTPGNYTASVNVTIGSMVHLLAIPLIIRPVSGPDFITRLWGSYSILQSWSSPVQEEIVSLGGFEGQASLTATVSPSVLDAPVVSFQPSTVTISANHSSTYIASLSAARMTPTGNYVITVRATSGTISHSYSAILMVGDYRPPTEEPPPSNNATTTSTHQSNEATTNQLLPILSPAVTMLESLWWLVTASGAIVVSGIVIVRRRQRRRD